MGHLIERGLTGATALLLLCCVADPAASQNAGMDAASLQAGARARILEPSASSRYTLIKVISSSADSLRYTLYLSPDTESVSWQRIQKMDASIGRDRHVGRGVGLGFLLGAIGGALAVSAIPHDQNESLGAAAIAVPLAGGALGAMAGGLVGFAWQSERWIPVAIPRTQ